jgi:hypothetical protein
MLRERPTLWFENDAQYDHLLLQLLIEHNPHFNSEIILVKDLADCEFEISRLRRMKRAAAAVEMPDALWSMAGASFQKYAHEVGMPDDPASLAQIVRQAAKGDMTAREQLELIMGDADVTYEMLLYKAGALSLNTMTAIEMALHRKERERLALNRMLYERQKANVAMGRAYLDALPKFNTDKPDDEKDGYE